MARLITEGWETGTLGNVYFYEGGVTIDSGTKRTGTYSVRFSTYTAGLYWLLPTAIDECYFRVAFWTSVSNNQEPVFRLHDSAGNILFKMAVISNHFYYYVGATNVGVGSTYITPWTVWYVVQVHVKMADTGGIIEGTVDGAPDFTYSGDTKSGGSAYRFALYGAYNSYSFMDDIAFNDTTGGVDDSWCGDGRIIYLQPSAAGDVTQLTPSTGSNWDCVDEVPASGTDYVYGTTIDNYDLYNLEASGIASTYEIKRVWPVANGVKLVADNSKLKLGIKTNSTEYWSSTDNNLYLSSLWFNGDTYLVNPNTSVAWTIDDLDALQVGVKVR